MRQGEAEDLLEEKVGSEARINLRDIKGALEVAGETEGEEAGRKIQPGVMLKKSSKKLIIWRRFQS